MKFTFLGNASSWPFSFPNLNFVPSASWEFYCVSRRSVQSRLPSFPQNRLPLDLNFEIRNLGPFLSESQLLLEYSHFSISGWVSPHHQHVDTGNYWHRCTCFQTCNYDTREDADIHTTMFYILPPHRQGISALVAGLASRLFDRLSSVCPFPVGTEKDACSSPFRLRSLSTAGSRLDTPVFFTPSADVSRFPEGCECRKLQESPFEQDSFAFIWKHSPVFRFVKEFCPFSFSYGHILCNLALNSWNFYFFELVQYAISHTISVCDYLVVLLIEEFLDCIAPQLFDLEKNLATYRHSKTLSDGGSLATNNALLPT